MTTVSKPAGQVDLSKWRLGSGSEEILGLIGFEPTGEEQARVLRSRIRRKLVVGGGQAGKSKTAAADFILHLYEDMGRFPGEPLLYWLVAADYERTRAEFGYIAESLLKLRWPVEKDGVSKRVDPGSIEARYPGAAKYAVRVETKSGKDPRTMAMYGPHGIVVCEASQVDLETYFKCLERLSSKNGWLHMSGTFESSLGWYPGMAAAWAHGSENERSFRIPSPTNFHAYPQGLETESLKELKKNTSDKYFLEKIMGIAAPPKGLVFGEFNVDKHIREVAYDPELPVHVSNDPGYGHANAVEVWQIAKNGQIRVFDEVYERGVTMSEVIDICMRREWWKNGDKKLVVDPHYANQHQGDRSMAEIWLAKTGLTPFGTRVKIAEGTERLSFFLKDAPLIKAPGIVFHPKCKGILSEMGAYPSPFDGQTRVYAWKLDSEGNVAGDDPEDKNNDGCKALIYGIVEWFGLAASGDNQFFTSSNLETRNARPGMTRRRQFLERSRR